MCSIIMYHHKVWPVSAFRINSSSIWVCKVKSNLITTAAVIQLAVVMAKIGDNLLLEEELVQTPHRKALSQWDSDPRPSCCEATVPTIATTCCQSTNCHLYSIVRIQY